MASFARQGRYRILHVGAEPGGVLARHCPRERCRPRRLDAKPINCELPNDVAVALHRANWDAGRMEPQKIKIQDQPVRQMGERMLTRLMHTSAMQFQISASYRKAAAPQAIFTSTHDAKAPRSDGTEAARRKTQKDPPARSSQQQNGYHHSAAGFTDGSKPMNAVNVQKSNGHASS
jgi:hypothetical protein